MIRPASARRTIGGLLVAAALVGACGSSGDDAEAPATTVPPVTTAAPTTDAPTTTVGAATTAPAVTTAAPTTVTPTTTAVPGPAGFGGRPSAGCGAPTEDRPGSITVTAPDGRERTALLALPAGREPDVPLPLVLDFHGLGSAASEQQLFSALGSVGNAQGFIVAHPDGVSRPPLNTPSWALVDTDDDPVDDFGFVVVLLDQLEAQFCIDIDRIHTAGMSNGGYFSTRLACELADRIASAASVAGVDHADDCAPARPISILHVHGTADEIVPFAGGTSALSEPGGALDIPGAEPPVFEPIPDQLVEWAATNQCPAEPAVEEIGPDVELRRWADCAAGTEVRFYVVDEGGHTWPGPAAELFESVLGKSTDHLATSEVIIEFFTAHPLAG